MSKRQIIILLGILIIVLPFLGFTSNWDTIISIIAGLLIVILSFGGDMSFKSFKSSKAEDNKANTDIGNGQFPFVEHKSES